MMTENIIIMDSPFPTPFLRDPTEAYHQVMDIWYPGFQNSSFFLELEEEDEEYVQKVLQDLTGFMLYYQDCTPSEWTWETVEHALLEDLPRSLYTDDIDYIYAIPSILELFFSYLDAEMLLPGSDKIAMSIDTHQMDFYEVMDDPDVHSFRKNLRLWAEEEGLDPADDTDVSAYFRTIGEQEMEGVDPEKAGTMIEILTSWYVPFSDSRHAATIEGFSMDTVTRIVSVVTSQMVIDYQDPDSWEPAGLISMITSILKEYPVSRKTKEGIIPVMYAFFSYLRDAGRYAKAQQMAEAVRSIDLSLLNDQPDDGLGEIAELLLHRLVEDGIPVEDNDAVMEYLEKNKESLFFEIIGRDDIDISRLLTGSNRSISSPDTDMQRKPVSVSTIPKERRDRYYEIIAMTDQFCAERLDDEYAHICREVAARLIRKRDCQALRGKKSLWAAGIVYAVGQLNFLFDKTFEPYQSADDICQYFDTKKSSTSQKAKLIRDIVGMQDYWDPDFSTSYMMNKNPFDRISLSRNGFFL